MAVRIQFRRGIKADWDSANPILAQGELGYESDTKKIKFGDGVNTWSALPVAAAGDITYVKAGTGLKYATGTDDTSMQFDPAYPVGGESGGVVLEIDPSVVVTAATINAKGDLLVGTADNSYTVLGAGANGRALVSRSSEPTGLAWEVVTDPNISNGYISNAMLAADSVQESNIRGSATVDANRSVTTDKIRDLNVTEPKLGTNAVTETKIASNAVITEKLRGDSNDANDSLRAVTTDKIRNSAITKAKIAANAVDSTKVDGTVYQRATTFSGVTNTARVFIQQTAPTGTAGDIWFRY